jgi:hypothetical protein
LILAIDQQNRFARQVSDLGVGSCVMNGQGQSLGDAKEWIAHYLDVVLAPLSA